MHTSGTRIVQNCGASAVYFSAIDECVPLLLASMPHFLAAFELGKTCAGQTVRSLDELEGLRFCDTIDSTLVVQVTDEAADFSALRDIEVITGASLRACSPVAANMLQGRSSSSIRP